MPSIQKESWTETGNKTAIPADAAENEALQRRERDNVGPERSRNRFIDREEHGTQGETLGGDRDLTFRHPSKLTQTDY